MSNFYKLLFFRPFSRNLIQPTTMLTGTYHSDDTIFLLKEMELPFSSIAEKEQKIRSGEAHYSEIVIREEAPGAAYLALFDKLYARHAGRLASEVAGLAKFLHETREDPIVLVSLARAGTPLGAMLGRCLRQRWGRDCVHFSISIIRDRGLDENALLYIMREKKFSPSSLVFLDGWTGKGAIRSELSAALRRWNDRNPALPLADELYVISDIGGVADAAATTDDYGMPFGLLNATACGLVSRSILPEKLSSPGDFHGAVIYRHLAASDQTNFLLDDMASRAVLAEPAILATPEELARQRAAMKNYIEALALRFAVGQVQHIKPGVAESTRAMLRRQPALLLLRDLEDEETQHLLLLARQKNVRVLKVENAPVRATALLEADAPDALATAVVFEEGDF